MLPPLGRIQTTLGKYYNLRRKKQQFLQLKIKEIFYEVKAMKKLHTYSTIMERMYIQRKIHQVEEMFAT
jgi:hypothetical protein